MVLARQAGELATYTYTHAGEGEEPSPSSLRLSLPHREPVAWWRNTAEVPTAFDPTLLLSNCVTLGGLFSSELQFLPQ